MAYNHRAHLAANLEALRLAFAIDLRTKAGNVVELTDEKRNILAAYSGFGALKSVLLPVGDDSLWKTGLDAQLRPGVQQLHALLAEAAGDRAEEFLSGIRNNVLSGFYTPPLVVDHLGKELASVMGSSPIHYLDAIEGLRKPMPLSSKATTQLIGYLAGRTPVVGSQN
ncbi:hypothetical protein [Spirosoma areae]